MRVHILSGTVFLSFNLESLYLNTLDPDEMPQDEAYHLVMDYVQNNV